MSEETYLSVYIAWMIISPEYSDGRARSAGGDGTTVFFGSAERTLGISEREK